MAVFDGTSLGSGPRKLFNDFFAFEQTLRNGVFIAAGDLDGDGMAEVIAGGGPGGGPRVTAFSSRDLISSGGGTLTQVANFFGGNRTGRDEVLLASPRDRDVVRRELAAYYAVIEYMDAQVGRILRTLEETRQLDNTLVIFSSDQGLALGSHGLVGKQNLYEHTFGVPLLMCGPGIPRGEKRDADCYLRDLFPTTCELAGVPIPPTVEGRSLVPILHGTADAVYPAVFGYFKDTQRCVRAGRWKLIRYPKAGVTQLFDLRADPGETRNLVSDPSYKKRVEGLLAKLQAEQAKWGDEVPLFPGK